MTKKLKITDLTLSGIPASMDTCLPGEIDSNRQKGKMKNEEEKGKEKVQKCKKRTSQKRLHVVENIVLSKPWDFQHSKSLFHYLYTS